MKEFISHIDYLIQKHDCVIIPDFGGFVLSHEGASFTPEGSITPPKVTVGFNPELKYNDGLLAESYMSVYSITYDLACKWIEEAVKRLNTILEMRHPVQIGKLGKLSLDKDDKLSFVPNTDLALFYPETFGFSVVNIKPLSDIQKNKRTIQKKSIYQRAFASVGTVAAAILVFFVASTPISENDNTQKSSLFIDLISSTNSNPPIVSDQSEYGSEINSASNERSEGNNSTDALMHQQENPSKNEDALVESVRILNTTSITATSHEIEERNRDRSDIAIAESKILDLDKNTTIKSTKKYYVIISGAANQAEAKRFVSKFKTQGFSQSDILTSPDRIRVYAESFETRKEAEEYSDQLRNQNPQFHDAWVYMKK